jgi:hypothetical protein
MVPFQLAGRAAPVDEGLIGQLVEQCGAGAIGQAIEALFGEKPVVLIGVAKPEAAVAGLLSLFPASCRRELSFTTGLKFSPRRPFHLLVASQESAELRRLFRQQLVSVVDLGSAAKSSPGTDTEGWAGFIAEAISQGAISLVVERLRERQDGLHLADLNELGKLWRQEAPNYIAPIQSRAEIHTHTDSQAESASAAPLADDNESSPACKCRGEPPADDMPEELSRGGAPESQGRGTKRAHFAKSGRGQTASAVMVADSQDNSQELLDELERLDDIVFDAMTGDTRAIEELSRMWPQLLAKLGAEKLDESREQYLRHSLTVWEACLENGLRDPDRAQASLQVLTILFGEQ